MCKEIRRSSARNTFIAESVYLVVIFVLGLAAGGEIYSRECLFCA